VTAAQFRRIALSLPQAEQGTHMDHPDFRVGGKIFATLGYPDKNWGMVKLFPDQQKNLMKAEPKVFVPAKGYWGRKGATCVLLKGAKEASLRKAIAAAWLSRAPKKLTAKFSEGN
jgi:hypothetical protein